MANIENNVIGIIARELRLNPRKVRPETLLCELGDSLDLIQIVLAFEEHYDLRVLDEEVEAFVTVGDIIKYISRCEEDS